MKPTKLSPWDAAEVRSSGRTGCTKSLVKKLCSRSKKPGYPAQWTPKCAKDGRLFSGRSVMWIEWANFAASTSHAAFCTSYWPLTEKKELNSIWRVQPSKQMLRKINWFSTEPLTWGKFVSTMSSWQVAMFANYSFQIYLFEDKPWYRKWKAPFRNRHNMKVWRKPLKWKLTSSKKGLYTFQASCNLQCPWYISWFWLITEGFEPV